VLACVQEEEERRGGECRHGQVGPARARSVRRRSRRRDAPMQALGVRCPAPRSLFSAPRRASAGTPSRAVQCRRSLRVSCGVAAAMALRTYQLDKLSAQEAKALLARPRVDLSTILETARPCAPLCLTAASG
jgi:hypothetical protein